MSYFKPADSMHRQLIDHMSSQARQDLAKFVTDLVGVKPDINHIADIVEKYPKYRS